MSATSTVWSAVSLAGRWIGALAGRGLYGGIAHALVSTTTIALLPTGARVSDLPDMLSFGAIIGAAIGTTIAVVVGLLTAPAAVMAGLRGRWGRLRPWVVALPTAALVAVAVWIEPPWPREPVDPFVLTDFLTSVVWLHLGPACWAGMFLYRLTAHWPPARRAASALPPAAR